MLLALLGDLAGILVPSLSNGLLGKNCTLQITYRGGQWKQ